MYIITDINDNILYWSNDHQEIDYIIKKEFKNKYICIYELNFHNMIIKEVKN